MDAPTTAAGFVALAESAAQQSFALTGGNHDFLGCAVYASTLGNMYVVGEDAIPPASIALKAVLTVKNIASAHALKRDLLMSLPGCDVCTDEDGDSNGQVRFSLNNEHGETDSVPCTCVKGQALYLAALARSEAA
jgi:hypothetical protein